MKDLIKICIGHLECREPKCFRCKISSRNEKQPCYHPTYLQGSYQGKSAVNEIRKDKKQSQQEFSIILSPVDVHNYYDAGQEREGEFFDRFNFPEREEGETNAKRYNKRD